MGKLEVGGYAEVIATGRIGYINDRNRNKIELRFCDNSMINPEYIYFKATELKSVEINMIKTSQLKALVRGELSLKELSGGTNYLWDYPEVDSKKYIATIEDLYAGYKSIKSKTPEEVIVWLDPIIQFVDEIDDSDKKTDYSIESEVLEYIYQDIFELYDFVSYEDSEEPGYNDTISKWVSKTCEELQKYIESKGEIVPEMVAKSLVDRFDDNNIDDQDEQTQLLFKRFLDQLCDAKDSRAIQKRGYCYYCGTKVYPNDWIKARDAFIEYYNLTGDASAANTLGYIYYYGRCNDGVPQYEEAFKYFSIGHAFGYYESTYKLADMFSHGYGVKEDGKTAFRMYDYVYTDNLKRFRKGDYECKFADAALRMGNCFRKGIGCSENIEMAYANYLEADLAIRERVKAANHYGDTVVYNGIQRALQETRELYTEKKKTIIFSYYPGWIKWMTVGHRRCRLTIKELSEGILSIKAQILPRYDENKEFKTLITVPSADYSELKKSIRLKTKDDSSYSVVDGTNEMVFNHISYDNRKNITKFYMDEKLVGSILTAGYIYKPNVSRPQKKEGEKYHFVSILFEKQGRTYDYLCDDQSVTAGDKVIVNGYNGETEVEVVNTFDKFESEIGLPIERYKKVVRKA